jgi:CRISPR-associated protein Cas2
MFVILSYDMRQERVAKARKIVKKYLRPVQRSVFEGHLSQSKLGHLKRELETLIRPEEDGVRIYSFPAFQGGIVDCLGRTEDHPDRVL